ncbi:MAG TPA: YbhN family protein [Gaiellaceae bacterium]|nr:YbhN family protein [Gaiellaceae bacterium]
MSKRRLLSVGLGAAIVAATFFFVLPRIANYRDVWDAAKDLSWRDLGILGLATLLNLVTYAPPWQAALRGLGFRRAFVMTQASTASTYLAPGGAAVGMALSYAMLRAWGFAQRPVAVAVAVVGVWNQFAMLGFPLIGLALLTYAKEDSSLVQTVALIGVVVFVAAAAAFAAVLATPRFARWAGVMAARVTTRMLGLVRGRPVAWGGESFVRFRNDALDLLKQRWHVITLATLAGHLTVFLLMLASLRAFGVSSDEISATEAFASWSLVRLLGSLPITPGGIGVVEVGLTGALVGFGGDNAEVVAAVLVYRFLAVVPTLVLGLFAGVTWRRYRPEVEPVPGPPPSL